MEAVQFQIILRVVHKKRLLLLVTEGFDYLTFGTHYIFTVFITPVMSSENTEQVIFCFPLKCFALFKY